MKKKLHKLCLVIFTLFTSITFSQVLTFDFEDANLSGDSSIVQTIIDGGNSYELTATINSGFSEIFDDAGNNLFYASGTDVLPEIWTVSLTRNGTPYSFNLYGVDYKRFCGAAPTFAVANNSGTNIGTTTNLPMGSGVLNIVNNNFNIDNFTISTGTDQGTQCTDFDNISIEPAGPVLGIEENVFNIESVFPNPASDKVTLSFTSQDKKELSVYDISGKIVMKKTSLNKKEIIDLTKFNSGVYFIKVEVDSAVKIAKIIKI